MKTCSKCGDTAAVYYAGSGNRCIPCVRNAQKEHKAAHCLRISADRKRDRAQPLGKARDLLDNMSAVSKKEGLPPPEFSLSEVTEICSGHCSQTGIRFELENNSKSRRNPFAPSPDRRDPAIGYTKDNVQWVCWIFNVMKCDFDQAVVDKFIAALQYK